MDSPMGNLSPFPQQLLDKLNTSFRASSPPVYDSSPDPVLAGLKELDLRLHLTRFEGIEFDGAGKALCPVHPETHPSFEVKLHTDGHWYWFDWHIQNQDGFSGTIIDYYVIIKKMTVAEAIRIIKEREIFQGTIVPTETDSRQSIVDTIDTCAFLKTGTELQALDINVEWTIDGILPARSMTLFYGPSGIGKTWGALGMARAASLGTPIFGRATIQRPVIYVDYENPLSVLIDRVRKLNIRDVKFWHLSASTPPPKLDSHEWTLFKRLPQGSILVFDTARASHNLDENSSEAPALVMGRLKELRELNHEILLLHHTTKADDQNAKGSTGWYDLADHTLSLSRVKRSTSGDADNGGGFESGTLLSLNVGKKTRFEPMPRIFLTFDPEVGFILADNPDASAINALADYIAGPGRATNQSDIIRWAKENNVGPGNRAAFISLLNRNEGIRWLAHRGSGGSKIYEPIV
jgi:hypothetical protein